MDEQKKREREKVIWQARNDRIWLGVVAALIYQALVVLQGSTSWQLFKKVLPQWRWPAGVVDSVILGTALFIASIMLFRSLGVGLHWPRSSQYPDRESPEPTLQMSVIVAVATLSLWEILQGDVEKATYSMSYLYFYLIACGVASAVLDCFQPRLPTEIAESPVKTLEDLTDQEFEDWLGDDAPNHRYDFFDRTPLIDRMHNRLISPQTPGQRGQILFGDYGSGKSTVIKLLQQKLKESTQERWLVVRFDTWGRSESPADITSMILDSILEAIRNSGVEMVSLLDVRNRYIQAAFQIESRLSVLAILSAKQSPENILKEVNRILLLNNLRMLIVIEDADRCHEADKVIDTIAGLLDRIAHLSACRFILTLKREAVKNDTALKLADFMEDVYSNANSELLKQFFKLCISQDSFVSPELRLHGADVWPLIDSVDSKINRGIDVLVPYLGNIRTTRLVLKATLDCWKQVKQGAYFTDVFITQIIRHDKRLEGDLAVIEKTGKRLPPQPSNSDVDDNESKIHPELKQNEQKKDSNENKTAGSLLKNLSNQPANRNSPFIGLIQRMAPDYWTDILNSRVSESNRIKEFFDALDLVSRNPDTPEQPVILDMMYFRLDIGPFAMTKKFHDQFIACWIPGFLAGLITHFVKKDYHKADAGDSARDFKEKTVLYLVDAMCQDFRLSERDSSELESAVAAIEEIKKHMSDVDLLTYVKIIKSGVTDLLSDAERESAGKNIFNVIIEKLRNPAEQDEDQ